MCEVFSHHGCRASVFDKLQSAEAGLHPGLSVCVSSSISLRVPLLYLQTVVGDVVRTLKVMYGSLDRFVTLCFSCVAASTLSFSKAVTHKYKVK